MVPLETAHRNRLLLTEHDPLDNFSLSSEHVSCYFHVFSEVTAHLSAVGAVASGYV